MKWLPLTLVLVAASSVQRCACVPVDSSENVGRNDTDLSLESALDIVTSFRDCFNSVGLMDCLRNVFIQSLNKAIYSNAVLRVTRFLVIRKNPSAVSVDAVDERTPLDWSTVMAKIRDFISSRTLQLSLVSSDGRSLIPFGFDFEGRGKKHNKHKHQGGMYMMGGAAVMAMMAQLVLGKVALLAAVALIMAKIALIFSTLNGFKKAAAASGGGTEHVVYDHSGGHGGGGTGGSGWQRSIEPKWQGGAGGQYDDDDLPPYRKRRPDYDYRDLDGAK